MRRLLLIFAVMGTAFLLTSGMAGAATQSSAIVNKEPKPTSEYAKEVDAAIKHSITEKQADIETKRALSQSSNVSTATEGEGLIQTYSYHRPYDIRNYWATRMGTILEAIS